MQNSFFQTLKPGHSAPCSQRCLLYSAGVSRQAHAQFGHHVPDGARVRRLDVPPVRMSVLLTQTPHVALHRQGPGLRGERLGDREIKIRQQIGKKG